MNRWIGKCPLCGSVLLTKQIQTRSDDEEGTLVVYCEVHGINYNIASRVLREVDYSSPPLKRIGNPTAGVTSVQRSPFIDTGDSKKELVFKYECSINFVVDEPTIELTRVNTSIATRGTTLPAVLETKGDVTSQVHHELWELRHKPFRYEGCYYTFEVHMSSLKKHFVALSTRYKVSRYTLDGLVHMNKGYSVSLECNQSDPSQPSFIRIHSHLGDIEPDTFMIDAHSIAFQLQEHGYRLCIDYHIPKYREWTTYFRSLQRSYLWVRDVPEDSIANGRVTHAKGIFSTLFSCRYSYLLLYLGRNRSPFLYPKSVPSKGTSDTRPQFVSAGFFDKEVVRFQVSEQYTSLEPGTISCQHTYVPHSESRFITVQEVSIDHYYSNDWRRITLGTDNNITIVRSSLDTDPVMLNRHTIFDFLAQSVLGACESYCSTTHGLYVFINSEPLRMYKNLTKLVKCIFMQRVDSDSDEEYEYEDEDDYEDSSLYSLNVTQQQCIQVRAVSTISEAIDVCSEGNPVLVTPKGWRDNGASKVANSLIMNLLDRDCSGWLPNEYGYIGFCPIPSVNSRVSSYRPVLSTMVEFDIKTSNLYKLTQHTTIRTSLPTIICTEGINSYLRDALC